MKTRSISKQLTIGNLSIVILMICLLGISITMIFIKAMNEEIASKNAIITNAYQDKVNHYLEGPVNAIGNLATELKGFGLDIEDETMDAYFSAVLSTFPYMESLRLCDSMGEVVFAMPGNSERDHMNVIYEDFFMTWPEEGDVKWSNIFISKEGDPTIALTARSSGHLIVAILDIAKLHESFELMSADDDINVYLVNKNGIIISSDDIGDVMMRKRHPAFSDMRETLASEKGVFYLSDDSKTMSKMIHLSGSKDWYLIVEYDRSELYRPIYMTILQIIIIASLVLLALIILIRRLSSTIIDEMSDLNTAALKIADGDYEHTLNHFVFKEFEDLSLSISCLAEAVRDREERINGVNSNLEMLVHQRTEELVQSNACLQELNAQLEEEVSEREKAEEKLSEMNINLTDIVEARTRTLLEKEVELQKALDAAQSATEEKSRFLADMSHEIRTPLNGLLGIIETFKHTGMDAEQETIIRSMGNCSAHLTSVINDVLDYSKIESGKFELHERSVDMGELIRKVIDVFSYSAILKGLALVDTSPTIENAVYDADGPRIRQVLSNIISNAIKFTREGQIEINYLFERVSDQETIATISIKDMGEGIPEESIERIFNRFEQSRVALGDTSGTGLGLAIANRIVEMMGGRISVSSQVGVGSVFKVVLPLKNAKMGAPAASSDYMNGPASVKRNDGSILLAEDDPTSLMVLKAILERAGYMVTGVTNGQEVLDELAHKRYDVILLDINMPILDGVETIKRIRSSQDANISRHKVIALTAYAIKGDKDKFIALGMDDYVSKPIDYDLLMAKIAGYLPEVTVVENVKSMQQKHSSTMSIMDLERMLIEASGLDAEKCRFIIEAFVQQSRQLLTRLHEAYESEDFENLHKLFHQIKGSSGNVRANELSDLAKKGEKAVAEREMDAISSIIGIIEDAIFLMEEEIQKTA